MTESWTIDEFVEQVAVALAAAGLTGPAPDRRTLRYYATLGVLSRPLPAGREVRYDRRHLLQVVAARRLQANGVRLAEIADRLAGLDDAALAALAEHQGPAAPAAARFWESQPHRVAPTTPTPSATPTPPAAPVRHRTELDLADGVSLTVPYHRLTPQQVADLRTAAAPLLAALTSIATLEETR